MNNTYFRSIRGPVLLTTYGALMLVDHFGAYSIWSTWPALLIVAGLLVLLDRTFASRPASDSNTEGSLS